MIAEGRMEKQRGFHYIVGIEFQISEKKRSTNGVGTIGYLCEHVHTHTHKITLPESKS